MKKNILRLTTIAALSLFIASCKKDPAPANPTPKAGTVKLEFNNMSGAENLRMEGNWYKNQNGDSFTVTKFNYYISNIKLNKADGSKFEEAESYHLVQQSVSSSHSFDIANVSAGTYNSITFTIGVDSLRNVSGAQSGALAVDNGMFWSWTTGYIMLKLEGSSPQSSDAGKNFQLHAGGFKGAYNTVRTVTMTLPNAITVNNDENHIHLSADVQKVLGGVTAINFAVTPTIMNAGPNGKMLADNYEKMFTITASGK